MPLGSKGRPCVPPSLRLSRPLCGPQCPVMGRSPMLGGRKGCWLPMLIQPSQLTLGSMSGSESERSLCSSLGSCSGRDCGEIPCLSWRRKAWGRNVLAHSGRGDCAWRWGGLVETVTGEWRRTQCTWGLLGNSVLGRTRALTQDPQQTTVVWAPKPQQDTGSE